MKNPSGNVKVYRNSLEIGVVTGILLIPAVILSCLGEPGRYFFVPADDSSVAVETPPHILVDERGVPLSIVVTVANRHDVTQVEDVLKNRVRKPRGRTKQHLCADAGYSGKNQKQS